LSKKAKFKIKPDSGALRGTPQAAGCLTKEKKKKRFPHRKRCKAEAAIEKNCRRTPQKSIERADAGMLSGE